MSDIRFIPLQWRKTGLKFGLIGLGKIMVNAEFPAYRKAGYNLYCGADLDESACRNAQNSWGVKKTYSDWREMIDNEKIDILNVAVSAEASSLRIEILKAAAERGIHVMMQKPLNTTLAACREMVDIAHNSGIIMCVNHNSRFAPVFRGIKHLLEQGVAGNVENITVNGRVAAPAGEILRNFSIHNFDIITWWLQKRPVSVKAFLNRRENGKRFATSVLVYDDGTLATCNDSSFFSNTFDWNVRIETERGVIEGAQVWSAEQGANSLTYWDKETDTTTDLTPGYHYVPEGFIYSMDQLVRAVEDGAEPMISGKQTLTTMEILFDIINSVDH